MSTPRSSVGGGGLVSGAGSATGAPLLRGAGGDGAGGRVHIWHTVLTLKAGGCSIKTSGVAVNSVMMYLGPVPLQGP